MTILAVGINHTTAPVALREKVNVGGAVTPDILTRLIKRPEVSEAAILSTCNRTELYCNLDGADTAQPIDWLVDYHNLEAGDLRQFFYQHPDAAAVRHILRVAAGLDSMVLGEPQVLGQLKSAYQMGLQAGSIGKLLGRLFQHSFRVAKAIRTTTQIGAHPISVAFATIRLAEQIFGDLSARTVLFIGAGDTIEMAARHLDTHHPKHVIFANRTLENAERLAHHYAAEAMVLNDIRHTLETVDIVISSTASPLPILGKGIFESAIKARKHRPMFVVDIAVPRDIEPEVGELNDVYLYTVDDLKDVIRKGFQNRQFAVAEAEKIVNAQVTYFMDWLESLDAVSTIRALRDQARSVQAEIEALAERELRKGRDPTMVLRQATRALTNKLIHNPSRRLRVAGVDGRKDLLSVAHELFDLKLRDPTCPSDDNHNDVEPPKNK